MVHNRVFGCSPVVWPRHESRARNRNKSWSSSFTESRTLAVEIEDRFIGGKEYGKSFQLECSTLTGLLFLSYLVDKAFGIEQGQQFLAHFVLIFYVVS